VSGWENTKMDKCGKEFGLTYIQSCFKLYKLMRVVFISDYIIRYKIEKTDSERFRR